MVELSHVVVRISYYQNTVDDAVWPNSSEHMAKFWKSY